MWAFGIGAVAALILWVPRLIGRVRSGKITAGDRLGASVLVVSVVWAAAMLSVPFSEGPYRCSPVAAGAEGRQTVYPDDAPRRTGELPLLERRDTVCDDAAKARGATSVVVVASGLLVCAGIGLVWRDRTSPSRARLDALHSLDA
jgi:hypothetical protein